MSLVNMSLQLHLEACGGHLQALMPAPDISASARLAADCCHAWRVRRVSRSFSTLRFASTSAKSPSTPGRLSLHCSRHLRCHHTMV